MKSKEILSTLIILTILAVSCQPKQKTDENKEIAQSQEQSIFPVEIRKIQLTEIEKTEEFTANINAWKVNHLGPAQPNQIENILVEVGDRDRKSVV